MKSPSWIIKNILFLSKIYCTIGLLDRTSWGGSGAL